MVKYIPGRLLYILQVPLTMVPRNSIPGTPESGAGGIENIVFPCFPTGGERRILSISVSLERGECVKNKKK